MRIRVGDTKGNKALVEIRSGADAYAVYASALRNPIELVVEAKGFRIPTIGLSTAEAHILAAALMEAIDEVSA